MYQPPGAGWGILLFALWFVWSAGSFFFAHRKSTLALPAMLWPLFLGFTLILLLIDSNLMYGELAASNLPLLFRGPIQILPKNTGFYLSCLLWLSLGLLLAYAFMVRLPRVRTWLALVLLGIAATTHLVVLRMVPFPLIDVFTVISEASVALLEGRNPYANSYTDIYQGQGVTPSGFGYLPGLFPWSVAGMVTAGDIRAGNIFSLVGMALIFVLASSSKGVDGKYFLACLVFLGGAGLFVAEQAWIDPILALLAFASTWLLRRRRMVAASILAGLLCTTKQYGVVAFCFLVIMAWNQEGGRPAAKFLAIAFLTGISIQAPFVLWNFDAYWNAVFVGIGNLPFRPDAYTLISWASAHGIRVVGMPLIGALIFLFLAWKCRVARFTDPAIILSAAATSYMGIFLTNRHAFCNYYQLVFLLLLGSLYFKEFDLDLNHSKDQG
jgi:hypothetical protein